MFEQSTLNSGPALKRIWTTGVGLTGNAMLLGVAILAPMVWPQMLPRAMFVTTVSIPIPTGPPKPRVETTVARSKSNYVPRPMPGVIYAPTSIPDKPQIIVDPPSDVAMGVGVVGGFERGTPGGGDQILNSILGAAAAPTPHAAPVNVPHTPPPEATGPRRYTVGGRVKMATLIHRVEPEYPAIAKQARVGGVVQLVGVIGIDGHLKELRLVNGHPLLAQAAIRAVSQWIYSPTELNGELVEVEAPITVTFRLQ